uniref:MD-2-related lipid-recognition domain-containing protein n=1 Tax=Anopheles albimanus TaxID=7167 RepID=A0A182F8B0_ANOAL
MRPPQQLLRALALMLALPELVENATKSPRPIWMKRLECVNEPLIYGPILACRLENKRNSPQLLSIIVNVTKPITKQYISSNLYAKNRGPGRTLMYGTTFEYCEFLSNEQSRNKNPVAILIYNYGRHNFPQIIRPCPTFGLYNVSHLPVEKNLIPPFITPGGYYFVQRFFNKRNETLLEYEAEFSVSAASVFNKTMTLFTGGV